MKRELINVLKTRYCDVKTHSLDEALELAAEARDAGKPLSIGLVGNAVDTHKAILDKGFKIDIITDQTSAHDPLNGYVPQGYSLEEAKALREKRS
ncbi:urocanate hydratase [Staphylococcus gallinarum]|uniref:Urocanate hydratase n=1 Tax=Staphylococcus gallinarum TaxID=1293 RepID=A0A380FKV3_STAGA|nr:urocanate hydratase [Staphylococcus gallinarum]